MSYYLTWIIADRNQATKISDVKNVNGENFLRLEVKGLSSLEISFLWAIIERNDQ